MALADDFWDLLGSWAGTEEQTVSPSGPATRARAALTFKLDLAGTAVVQDYRQVLADGSEFSAHGVFLADETSPEAVLWWLFDSAGHAPDPGRGGWAGRVLELVRSGPRGSATHRFELGPDRLAYRIDLTTAGGESMPVLRGRYERIASH